MSLAYEDKSRHARSSFVSPMRFSVNKASSGQHKKSVDSKKKSVKFDDSMRDPFKKLNADIELPSSINRSFNKSGSRENSQVHRKIPSNINTKGLEHVTVNVNKSMTSPTYVPGLPRPPTKPNQWKKPKKV